MLGNEKERTEKDSSHCHCLQTLERQRVACCGVPRGAELAYWKAVLGEQFGSHEEGFSNGESWLSLERVPCHWRNAPCGGGGHETVD